MKHISSQVVLGFIACLLFGIVPATAQNTAQNQEVRVFKTRNGSQARVPPRINPAIIKQKAPPHLPPTQLSNLIGKQVGQTYVLKLGHLSDTIGAIILQNVEQVQEDSATLSTGSALLYVKHDPNGQSYVADCIVGGTADSTLTLSSLGGQTETWKLQGKVRHLIFLLSPDSLSKPSDDYFLYLKGDANWGFYSCSISLVQ
jgi:hypothetical protein